MIDVVLKYWVILLFCSSIYFISIIIGALTPKQYFKKLQEKIKIESKFKIEQVDKVFGKHQQKVTDGDIYTTLKCILLLICFNTFACLSMFSLFNVFLLPFLYTNVLTPYKSGFSIERLIGSRISITLHYYLMVFLELASYILGTVAGLILPLSLLFPSIQNVTLRLTALGFAFQDFLHLYLIILCILCLQAIVEIYYVRRLLKSGREAIPLALY